MELIVISESKLKIMLTAPDMAHYELETARMDCADAHTRAAFRHIFDDARAEIGFDTQGERLFIQLYASKEGGCEIFVTKLGDRDGSFPACEGASCPPCDIEQGSVAVPLTVATGELSEGERALLRRICDYGEEEEGMAGERTERLLSTVGVRGVALVFSDVGDLLPACRRLLREGYRGRSTVYIAESGSHTDWYLLLDVPDVTVYRLPRRFAFLAEYGREVDRTGLEVYLGEYGRCIREGDGVEVMGRL